MPSEIAGLISVGVIAVFLIVGMPVAMAAALAGFLGLWYLAGATPALTTLGIIPYSKAATYGFSVLPLFIIMGYFAFNAGLASQAFETGKRWLGHIPGGLALATVAGCAFFAAACGMSTAAAATMGKIVIPEMEKLNYKPGLAAGVVAASGTFATMIPPSALLVIYAIMVEVSIGKMLLAGVFPGLLTAVFYAAMLYVRVKRDPSLTGDKIAPYPWRERLRSLPQLWGVGVIAATVIGGIYFGWFTPTEAAAISAFVALILLLTRRGTNRWTGFKNSLLEAGRTTAMVFLILVGIVIFAQFLALSRLPYTIVEFIGGLALNRYIILAIMMVFYVILGMFMETLGMLLLTIPVAIPIILSLGFDPIWFGILTVKTIEIALVTPPVGMTVYVVKGVAPHIPMGEIFRGVIPFIAMDILVLVLLIAFPQIAMFLPNTMSM